MRFKFHPQAVEEYEESARYYASCQAGLELRFIDCVESALRQASEAPTRWAVFILRSQPRQELRVPLRRLL